MAHTSPTTFPISIKSLTIIAHAPLGQKMQSKPSFFLGFCPNFLKNWQNDSKYSCFSFKNSSSKKICKMMST